MVGITFVALLHGVVLYGLWHYKLIPAPNEAVTLFVNLISPPPPKVEPQQPKPPKLPREKVKLEKPHPVERPKPVPILTTKAPVESPSEPVAPPPEPVVEPPPAPATVVEAPPNHLRQSGCRLNCLWLVRTIPRRTIRRCRGV